MWAFVSPVRTSDYYWMRVEPLRAREENDINTPPDENDYDYTYTWSGYPDPDDPDTYWIDDLTGERVHQIAGERTPPGREGGRDDNLQDLHRAWSASSRRAGQRDRRAT